MNDVITLGDFGKLKLNAICNGLQLSQEQVHAAVSLFDLVSESWSSWKRGDIPHWRTDLSDDYTPFEFSVEFRPNDTKLRVLLESQQLPITPESSWHAGLQLNERIRHLPGVDLSKFERIYDLFTPAGKPARFTIWHSAVLDKNGECFFKVYLNPQIHGTQSAPKLVQEALSRLQLDHAWDFIAPQLEAAPERAQLAFFSLDLSQDKHARVKVYLSNVQMSLSEIEHQLRPSRNYESGMASNWIKKLTGIDESLDNRHILNYFAFTSEDTRAPLSNVQVPIRWYVENDTCAMARTLALLPPHQQNKLQAIVHNLAERPLEMGRGLLAHVSVRQDKGELCVITYLSAEAYSNFYFSIKQ